MAVRCASVGMSRCGGAITRDANGSRTIGADSIATSPRATSPSSTPDVTPACSSNAAHRMQRHQATRATHTAPLLWRSPEERVALEQTLERRCDSRDALALVWCNRRHGARQCHRQHRAQHDAWRRGVVSRNPTAEVEQGWRQRGINIRSRKDIAAVCLSSGAGTSIAVTIPISFATAQRHDHARTRASTRSRRSLGTE